MYDPRSADPVYYNPGTDELFLRGNRYVRADDGYGSTCDCPVCSDDSVSTGPLKQVENTLWDLLKVVIDAQK